MEWESKITVKKGNIGEEIVKNALERRGYSVYKSVTNGAHPFDLLAVKNKREFVIAEVKTKARLNKFKATGIDARHYDDYFHVMEKHNIDVVICFVDEHPEEERIYCQKLSRLAAEYEEDGVSYPNFSIIKGIVLFPLSKMVTIENLTSETVLKLKEVSTRNHDYL